MEGPPEPLKAVHPRGMLAVCFNLLQFRVYVNLLPPRGTLSFRRTPHTLRMTCFGGTTIGGRPGTCWGGPIMLVMGTQHSAGYIQVTVRLVCGTYSRGCYHQVGTTNIKLLRWETTLRARMIESHCGVMR